MPIVAVNVYIKLEEEYTIGKNFAKNMLEMFETAFQASLTWHP